MFSRTIRRSHFIILLSVIVLVLCAASPDENTLKPVPDAVRAGFESITAGDALSYNEFLASDELEGRDTPSRGLTIARRYVISLYKNWGIAPLGDPEGNSRSYEQRLQIAIPEVSDTSCIEIVSPGITRRFGLGADFRVFSRDAASGVMEAPVVFAGYGFRSEEPAYDDFAGIDLRGKIALLLQGIPGGEDSPLAQRDIRRRYIHLRQMGEELSKAGALAVLMVEDDRFSRRGRRTDSRYIRGKEIRSESRPIVVPALQQLDDSLSSYNISEAVAATIFSLAGESLQETREAIDSKLKPQSMPLEGVTVRLVTDVKSEGASTANVLGMIEGSDPELKNEYVILGAHLDHVGITAAGYVFNGADDNASGSSGVLEVAQAFAVNPVKPKRTVVFAHWTGEEKGLYGSRYFVEFPTIPRDKIVAYINMDMIGRDMSREAAQRMARMMGETVSRTNFSDEDMKRLVMGSSASQSPELNDMMVRLNADHVGLWCEARQSPTMSGGSDHAPFHAKGIPAAGFFTGIHDDYHTPSDTVDRINAAKMQDICRLAYLMLYEIADRDARVTWTAVEE